jgi:hypothetical protein
MGHGISPVWISSFLARHDQFRREVSGLVYFGGCRFIPESSSAILLNQLGKLSSLAARLRGDVPGKWLNLGVQDENPSLFAEWQMMAQSVEWVDAIDGYDYGAHFRLAADHPPVLNFASRSDPVGFASVNAVARFMKELGEHDGRLVVLGNQDGNLHNYSHIGMLTHPDAERDHFPFMLEWLSLSQNK